MYANITRNPVKRLISSSLKGKPNLPLFGWTSHVEVLLFKIRLSEFYELLKRHTVGKQNSNCILEL